MTRQRLGMDSQAGAVGRQREFVQPASIEMARQPGDEIDEALPNERLAARQPEAPRTQPDEGRAKAIEFVQRQQILARQESLPFGHAQGPAQVDRKSTRLNSSHQCATRMPSSA